MTIAPVVMGNEGGEGWKFGNSQRSPVHHHHIHNQHHHYYCHHHHHHPPHPNQNPIIAREVCSTTGPIWSKSRSCSDRYTWWRGLQWTIIVLKWHLHRCHHPHPHHHHHHQKPEKVDFIPYTWWQGFEWTIILLSGIYLHHYHHSLIPILTPAPDHTLPTWER